MGKNAIFALMIISSLAFTVVGAKFDRRGRQNIRRPGFVGEPINLKVVNADIRDILNYITEQYGINFVIDKSVSTFR